MYDDTVKITLEQWVELAKRRIDEYAETVTQHDTRHPTPGALVGVLDSMYGCP